MIDTRRSAHRPPLPEQNVDSVSGSRKPGERWNSTAVRRTTQAVSLASAASAVSSLETSWQ